jgi:hypothetical protein
MALAANRESLQVHQPTHISGFFRPINFVVAKNLFERVISQHEMRVEFNIPSVSGMHYRPVISRM